jgi:hypothetical protein
MNPKKIFDFIGEKNPKYELKNVFKWNHLFNPNLYSFMDNPTEEVIKTLVKRDHNNLFLIENPSIELQIIAIRSSKHPGHTFVKRYINEKGETGPPEISRKFDLNSYEIQHEFVQKDGRMIVYFDDPSEEIQLTAVMSKPESIKFIDNPTEKVIKYYNQIIKSNES